MDFIEKWWKLALALIVITLLIIGGLSSNKVYNRAVKAEKDLLDVQYKIDTIQESIRQNKFNTIIKIIEVDNSEKEKQADEIKEYIKNPTVDLSNKHIQDSIGSKFYYRYPKDGTSIRTISSFTK